MEGKNDPPVLVVEGIHQFPFHCIAPLHVGSRMQFEQDDLVHRPPQPERVRFPAALEMIEQQCFDLMFTVRRIFPDMPG
ncbi:hypothetical protein D3C75_1314600 [compost metagenome]